MSLQGRCLPNCKKMEGEKKGMLYVIIVIVVIAVLGWWFFSASPQGGNESVDVGSEEGAGVQELTPSVQLTPAEAAGDVSVKKAEILSRVRSGTLLTQEEKADIGGIMLTKANVYNFTEEERNDIFTALSRE